MKTNLKAVKIKKRVILFLKEFSDAFIRKKLLTTEELLQIISVEDEDIKKEERRSDEDLTFHLDGYQLNCS